MLRCSIDVATKMTSRGTGISGFRAIGFIIASSIRDVSQQGPPLPVGSLPRNKLPSRPWCTFPRCFPRQISFLAHLFIWNHHSQTTTQAQHVEPAAIRRGRLLYSLSLSIYALMRKSTTRQYRHLKCPTPSAHNSVIHPPLTIQLNPKSF